MGKVYFLFGVHNHQPVGNFSHIFKKAYDTCYRPFLELIAQFPKIKFCLHNSGCLYDWLFENVKDYIALLKKLIKRGQVELISGGYYEPILPIVSDADKIGQITLMNEFIEKEFKTKPKGVWTAERVWEPYLARIISQCNLQYTFLDDTHFRYAGLSEKEFFGYYTTEDEARAIQVFPISKTLRYKIPFSRAEEALAILHSFRGAGQDVLVTIFDDGEKFGLWPNTYDWVYNKEWLKNFLSLLSEAKDIETITASEACEKFAPTGIVYLPTAAYEEMGEWVLRPEGFAVYEDLKNFLKAQNRFEEFKDFIRGGFFRNFYSKYSRLNYMHKRMLWLSKKIHSQAGPLRDRDIFTNLFKAQTNCGYWHGIFGGFYLSHIRGAIYENLINAENLFDKRYNKRDLSVEEDDINLDGLKEVLVKNKHLICCLSPLGGTLLELSLREPPFNLINTITRKEESYHKKIRENVTKADGVSTIHEIVKQKDKDLEQHLIYDTYERLGLVDHLLEKDLDLNSFNAQEGIYTLSDRPYEVSIKEGKSVIIDYRYSDKGIDFSKEISFSSGYGLAVTYNFKKRNLLKKYNFGVEFNLSLPSLNGIFKKEAKGEVSIKEPRAWQNVRSFSIIDHLKDLKLEFSLDAKVDIFTLPIYSVSSSEDGFEKVYQEIAILFILKNSRESFRLALDIVT